MPRDFEFGRLGQRTSFLFGISSWPIDVDDGGDKKPTTFAKNPPPEASPYPKDLNRSRQAHDPPNHHVMLHDVPHGVFLQHYAAC